MKCNRTHDSRASLTLFSQIFKSSNCFKFASFTSNPFPSGAIGIGKIPLGFLAIALFLIAFSSDALAWSGTFSTGDGWHWRNPQPFGGHFYCVDMLDQESVVIAGSYGVIAKTTDLGENLTQAEVPDNLITAVSALKFFDDSEVGFAVSDGKLMTSNNGGLNWHYVESIGNILSFDAWDLCYTDGRMYVLLSGHNQQNNYVAVKANEDGEWGVVLAQEQGFSGLRKISYPYSWNESQIFQFHEQIVSTEEGHILDVEPIPDTNEFFYALDSTLLWDSNQEAWQFEQNIHEIAFSDDNTVYVSTTHLYRSTDCGNNFDDLGNLRDYINKIDFLDSENGFAVGAFSRAVYTINSGNFWSNSMRSNSYATGIRNIYFNNSDHGFMQTGNCQNPLTFETHDGGESWEQIAFSRQNLVEVDRFWVHPNHNYFYVIEGNGDFSRLNIVDYSVPQLIRHDVRDFMFVDADTAWFVRDHEIFRSTDGGLYWDELASLDDDLLRAVFFVNPRDGYVAGKQGRVLKTSDGGFNWQDVSVAGVDVNALYFLSADVGFAAGNEGVVFRTRNGGITWRPLRTNRNDNIYCIKFWSDTRGYVVVSDGILVTDDGGDSFEFLATPLGFSAGYEQKTPSICFTDETLTRLQYARGSCILYRDRLNWAVGDVVSLQPVKFDIIACYPNPFNSTTTIGYSLPSAGTVSLTVYDLSGREVARLVDGVKAAGTHEAMWVADGVASGVYVVALDAGGMMMREKVVLVR